MCAHQLRLVVVFALLLCAHLPVLSGQNVLDRNRWELGLGTAAGIVDGAAFGGSGTGVTATGSLTYRFTERFVLRGGVSFAGFDNFAELTGGGFLGLGLSFPGWGETQYWSAYAGPGYSVPMGASNVTPYASGRLAFVKESGGLSRTGISVGGSTGIRVQLMSTLGLELGIDTSWAHLYRPYRRVWESGGSLMLSAGVVVGL